MDHFPVAALDAEEGFVHRFVRADALPKANLLGWTADFCSVDHLPRSLAPLPVLYPILLAPLS